MGLDIEEKMLLARAEDTVALCEKQNCIRHMGFLTPAEAELIRRNIGKSSVSTIFFGGYTDAERTLFVALPDYLEEESAKELISVVEIRGREIEELRHPDFLGSLLGLGIRREKIGDILVLDEKCLVFADPKIAEYIAENLTKVGRKGVSVKLSSLDETEIPPRKTELICGTVSALRLDSVVAVAVRTSRSAAVSLLSEGRVFVNWTQEDSPSFKIKPGDVFSVRGFGRFRLGSEMSETRKGRLGIRIEKMI